MALGYGLITFLAVVSLMTGLLQPLMLALLGAFCMILIEWANK
jgi:hypothetical protein